METQDFWSILGKSLEGMLRLFPTSSPEDPEIASVGRWASMASPRWFRVDLQRPISQGLVDPASGLTKAQTGSWVFQRVIFLGPAEFNKRIVTRVTRKSSQRADTCD